MKASKLFIAAAAALAGAVLASSVTTAAPLTSLNAAGGVIDTGKQATGMEKVATRRVYRRTGHPYWRGYRYGRCWNCGGRYWRQHRYYGYGYPYYGYGGYPY